MKLINEGLKIKNAQKTFGFDKLELAELKFMLPQIVQNVTEDEIILWKYGYGILHVVEQGNSIFPSTGERIGIQKTGYPANGEKWKLEMTDSDESVYIRNTVTNEYLFTTEHTHPKYSYSKMTSLALTPGGSEFEWIFEYHQDEGFYIRNSRNSQYLFPSGMLPENKDNFFVVTYPAAFTWSTYK